MSAKLFLHNNYPSNAETPVSEQSQLSSSIITNIKQYINTERSAFDRYLNGKTA